MLKKLNIKKTIGEVKIPEVLNISLEFHGYDKPLKCAGDIINPLYHEISTFSVFVLQHDQSSFRMPLGYFNENTLLIIRMFKYHQTFKLEAPKSHIKFFK